MNDWPLFYTQLLAAAILALFIVVIVIAFRKPNCRQLSRKLHQGAGRFGEETTKSRSRRRNPPSLTALPFRRESKLALQLCVIAGRVGRSYAPPWRR